MQTGQYSTQIFSLAVLLSSLFIYNQMGGIDEAALDRLSLVTEMTKHIRVRASDGASSDPSELSAFTPSFIWLLRDFYLKLEEEGRAVTPRGYLEAALQSLAGTTPAVQSKNNIRDSIKTLFPDRDCFTLVRPVNEEDALAKLDTLPSTQLRPEFKQGLSSLTRMIFQKAHPKRLGPQVLTGGSLAALTEAYVSAINAGAVPTIATAWQGVAEAESRRAADAAEEAYAAAFPRDVAADDAALESAHQGALLEAQKAFDSAALGDESIRKANERRWREACSSRFRELREKKLATAELACERAINEASTRLAAVVRREGATLEDLRKEADAFQERYNASRECSGPAKWRRLADFMRDVYGNAQRDLASRQAERQQIAAQQAQQAAASAQTALQQASARATSAEGSLRSLQTRIGELERQLAQANTELSVQRQAAATATAQLAQVTQSAQARDAERTTLAEQLRTAQHAESQARRQLTAVQHQVVALQQQLNEASAAGTQAWASERGRMEAIIASVTAARDAAQAARASAEASRSAAEQRSLSLEAQISSLQAQISSLQTAALNTVAPLAVEDDHTMGEDVLPEPPAVVVTAPPVIARSPPDTSKMTVNAMKNYLTENGQEAKVWEMSQAKAKKSEWAALINSL